MNELKVNQFGVLYPDQKTKEFISKKFKTFQKTIIKYSAEVEISDNYNLVPTNQKDKEFFKKFKPETILTEFEIETKRSYPQLKLYWELMSALEFHFSDIQTQLGTIYMSKMGWHEHFKKVFLGTKKSVSFKKMRDQKKFNEYFDNIKKWLANNGYDYQEILDNTPQI